jgi:addiction module HigA family antidote
MTVTEAAKALGVTRVALSELVNERRGVSLEMAIRLAKAFGSAPQVWAGMQLDYDLAQAMKAANRIKVRRVRSGHRLKEPASRHRWAKRLVRPAAELR